LKRNFQTVSSISSLFLALVLYPEVQERAQAELDSVISRDRLPTYGDKPRLPYIEAMSKELLRWQMVTPMGSDTQCSKSTPSQGVPHSLNDDDVYKGYFIPKGLEASFKAFAV
jgi:cytochrome P450